MFIYTLGRLGLRRGELAHLNEEWIDWRRDMITIPSHHRCDYGKGGAVCGYCSQLARDRAARAEELSVEEALRWMWVPKTEAAAREVYFGFDARAKLYLERYFDSPEYSRVEVGGNAIGKRVKRAAEEAPALDPEPLSPHVLRATAATYHAARGLELLQLMQLFGWSQPSTAEIYIGRNGTNTARQLDAIHST
jgi:integrase